MPGRERRTSWFFGLGGDGGSQKPQHASFSRTSGSIVHEMGAQNYVRRDSVSSNGRVSWHRPPRRPSGGDRGGVDIAGGVFDRVVPGHGGAADQSPKDRNSAMMSPGRSLASELAGDQPWRPAEPSFRNYGDPGGGGRAVWPNPRSQATSRAGTGKFEAFDVAVAGIVTAHRREVQSLREENFRLRAQLAEGSARSQPRLPRVGGVNLEAHLSSEKLPGAMEASCESFDAESYLSYNDGIVASKSVGHDSEGYDHAAETAEAKAERAAAAWARFAAGLGVKATGLNRITSWCPVHAMWVDVPPGVTMGTRKTMATRGNLAKSSTDMRFPVRHAQTTLNYAMLKFVWDLVAFLLIVYSTIAVPVEIFCEITLPSSQLPASCLTAVFWTMDFSMSLWASLRRDAGDRFADSLQEPRRRYQWSHFTLDIVLLALDWGGVLAFLVGTSSRGGSLIPLRSLRILRLLRGVHATRVIGRILASPSLSGTSSTFIQLFDSITLWIFGSHLIACLWYTVGSLTNGWVVYMEGKDSAWYKYFTALHWVLTQIHGTMEVYPTNCAERIFATVATFFAFLGNTWFVSNLTYILLETQTTDRERRSRTQALFAFFAKHQVSTGLKARMRTHLALTDKRRQASAQEARVLDSLSAHLLADVLVEMRLPLVRMHPFFSQLCEELPRATVALCHRGLYTLQAWQDDVVFDLGDSADQMFFVSGGEVQYELGVDTNQLLCLDELLPTTSNDDGIGSGGGSRVGARTALGRGAFVAEAALWLQWMHMGSLRAASDASLLSLRRGSLADVVSEHPFMHRPCASYARAFRLAMIRHGGSDILDNSSLRLVHGTSLLCE
mmetsp:Transcript_48603/g.141597  ORF Transcript_48603/g.141597 Transcript_48603/m.141597 type:complete len:839 (-) Transcript_48603:103-2619(-)